METLTNVVVALLLASGVLVTVRLVRGPSMLDRAVALDALVAVVMAGIGVLTAVRQIPFYLPALLVLSFLGFTGSVSIARFLALRDEAGTDDADEGESVHAAGHDDAEGRPGANGDEQGSGG
ncbi:monovalent cation/H+ antiporter complex subunit F [Streptomyces ovatisporus]|uniref:Monovalent cation/H+ antiporter complex subunit F n=1 Tax=Streptomyces ovatisporus TaxID=1128682 RepID=A0ABV9A7B5_9ACTN